MIRVINSLCEDRMLNKHKRGGSGRDIRRCTSHSRTNRDSRCTNIATKIVKTVVEGGQWKSTYKTSVAHGVEATAASQRSTAEDDVDVEVAGQGHPWLTGTS